MLFQRLQDLVRVQLEVAHDLPEHVPLDLRKGQAHVLVGEQRVLSPPRFVDRAVNDTLCGLSQLVLWDVEVLHGVLQAKSKPVAYMSKCRASPPPWGRRDKSLKTQGKRGVGSAVPTACASETGAQATYRGSSVT